MALTRELNELTCRLAKSVEFARSSTMRDLERSVCGCDYGSTSGTTRREAEQIARLLGLRPGIKLLDAGAGSGWPGLYLAQLTGCEVVIVDIPLAALRIAHERAVTDGLSQRCGIVAADAAALPFKEGSFDALSHSDLLCCTPDKLGVLRACRRVARDDARMVFTVIAPAPSLAASERQLAVVSGPKFVDTEDDYAVLLDRSGWWLQERRDKWKRSAFSNSSRDSAARSFSYGERASSMASRLDRSALPSTRLASSGQREPRQAETE